VLDEATLRELYLLPFEIAVAEADPWSVMAAYNDVNGVPATEQDHVINEIVKGEWGWTGWSCPTGSRPSRPAGRERRPRPGHARAGRAVGRRAGRRGPSGEVAESVVDDHLRRLLRLADRVGALGAPPPATRPTCRARTARPPRAAHPARRRRDDRADQRRRAAAGPRARSR
jgi:beta-glucosidase